MVRMAESKAALLDEIEAAVLDEQKSITEALRKCLVLGGKASSGELRDWARQELNGYEGPVPDYRVIRAPLAIDGSNIAKVVTGQRISSQLLPKEAQEFISEELTLAQGISRIETMAAQAKADNGFIKLSPQGSAELVLLMTKSAQEKAETRTSTITDIYWQVSFVDLNGILDRVRTMLTEFVAEVRARQPDEAQEPKSEMVQQVVNNYFAPRSRVGNVTTNQAAGNSKATIAPPTTEEEDTPGWSTAKKVGAFLVGLAGIVVAVAAVATWAPWN